MSGYVFELTFHAVCMPLGHDDPTLGLQGPASRAWAASPGWLWWETRSYTQSLLRALMQAPRKTTPQKCIKHMCRCKHTCLKVLLLLLLFYYFFPNRLDEHCQPRTKMLLLCTMNYLLQLMVGVFCLFFWQMERNVYFKMEYSQSEIAGGCKTANSC